VTDVAVVAGEVLVDWVWIGDLSAFVLCPADQLMGQQSPASSVVQRSNPEAPLPAPSVDLSAVPSSRSACLEERR